MMDTPTVRRSLAPRATLTNGVRVVNFSSPHSFEFEDGTTLRACGPERVLDLPLRRDETIISNHGPWSTIRVGFLPTETVWDELLLLAQDDTVDIILVPRVMLDALRAAGHQIGKCRTGLLKERDLGAFRAKVHYIDRFCA